MKTQPTLNACLRKNRIYLNRVTISLLGDPLHLSFGYNEEESRLYISAASKDDLDAYEIPKFFWKTRRSCEVARISFLRALQYRLNWENDFKYSYAGTLTEREGFPAIAFNMSEGTKLKTVQRRAETEEQSNSGCSPTDFDNGGESSEKMDQE